MLQPLKKIDRDNKWYGIFHTILIISNPSPIKLNPRSQVLPPFFHPGHLISNRSIQTHIFKFDMLNEKSQQIIDKVKAVIDKGIQTRLETGQTVKFSTLIFEELNTDYGSLDLMFKSLRGHSLDHFITERILEKVKELLVYTGQSFKEIAGALGYSSTWHLSRELKKQTGLTASHFKQIRREKQAVIEGSLK
jgi:AraC-like DNA-binding protein